MEGDPIVEPYMVEVSKALDRHFPRGSATRVEIYNRCYEAVRAALRGARLSDTKEGLMEVIHGHLMQGVRINVR